MKEKMFFMENILEKYSYNAPSSWYPMHLSEECDYFTKLCNNVYEMQCIFYLCWIFTEENNNFISF